MHYAAQSPRGFSNEITVHAFTSRPDRDAWVDVHADDGGVNSASQGALAITAQHARSILNDKGDGATAMYHSLERHYPASTAIEPTWLAHR